MSFTVSTYQNEYLPSGASEVHAVVTVTAGADESIGMNAEKAVVAHRRHQRLDELAGFQDPRRPPGHGHGRRAHPRRHLVRSDRRLAPGVVRLPAGPGRPMAPAGPGRRPHPSRGRPGLPTAAGHRRNGHLDLARTRPGHVRGAPRRHPAGLSAHRREERERATYQLGSRAGPIDGSVPVRRPGRRGRLERGGAPAHHVRRCWARSRSSRNPTRWTTTSRTSSNGRSARAWPTCGCGCGRRRAPSSASCARWRRRSRT